MQPDEMIFDYGQNGRERRILCVESVLSDRGEHHSGPLADGIEMSPDIASFLLAVENLGRVAASHEKR